METIVVANQKGGVGKTTTAQNIAAGIFRVTGMKPLLVDLDPQGNITIGCGYSKNDLPKTVYDFMMGAPFQAVGLADTSFDLIPSNGRVADLELALAPKVGREKYLTRALQKVPGQYQYVICDCPADLGLITVNALIAADHIFVPVQCGYYALEGLDDIDNTLRELSEAYGMELSITGVIATFFEKTKIAQAVRNDLRRRFRAKLFDTVVRKRVALEEAPSFGQDVFAYAPESDSADDYRNLTNEVLRRIG